MMAPRPGLILPRSGTGLDAQCGQWPDKTKHRHAHPLQGEFHKCENQGLSLPQQVRQCRWRRSLQESCQWGRATIIHPHVPLELGLLHTSSTPDPRRECHLGAGVCQVYSCSIYAQFDFIHNSPMFQDCSQQKQIPNKWGLSDDCFKSAFLLWAKAPRQPARPTLH